jgi:TRAP-type mannitol/chloroaromatic compound transport system substrate-binding protein
MPGADTSLISRRGAAKAVLAGAATAIAAPAVAQSMPTVNWRLVSSFPKSLDTLFQGGPSVAKFVREMSDNKFNIQVFAAGEIVPGLQVLDAVQNKTVECCHTYSGYFIGKEAALIFDGSLPFGLLRASTKLGCSLGVGEL